jgi:predicted esterase YcpF (UPF0227 family)
MAMTRLLYLHGFRSSPLSFKSRRLHDWLQVHRPDVQWCAPLLPPSPEASWQLVNQVTTDWPAGETAVIGSSLGGFYATAFAEAHGCRALLLNPAVDPARDLAPYVGELSYFHAPEQRFTFRDVYLDELRTLAVPAITWPERYSALIAKGDEVLDWREMTGRYPGATIRLLEGSDHGLSDFETHLPWVLEQLQLT